MTTGQPVTFLTRPVSTCINSTCSVCGPQDSQSAHHGETMVTLYNFEGPTPALKKALQCRSCSCIYNYSANMTHFFQPLKLTVNGAGKNYMKKFIVGYSYTVKQQLHNGKRLKILKVDFRLTTIKPLHAQWLVDMYNFITTDKG